MKHYYIAIFALCALMVLSPGTARADCSAPVGVEGEQVYNSTHDVMQYCDGTDWVAMNAIAANTAITSINTSLSSLTTTVGEKVAKAGDTMTGLLTLSGAPTANDHAATKEYVDTVAAAGGASDNGRYQISCSAGSATMQFCVLLDTQTRSSKCQYFSGYLYQSSSWSDCGGQLNITSLSGGGIPDSGGTAVYAANAYGWGQSRLGDGTTSTSSVPKLLDLNLAFSKIVASSSNSGCGLASGKIYCWGSPSGYGSMINISGTSNSPTAVDLSSLSYPTVTELYQGDHKGAFKTPSGWYGFGTTQSNSSNYYTFGSSGQSYSLAYWSVNTNGTGTGQVPTDFTKFVFGNFHMCGLRSNGDIHCAAYYSSTQSVLAAWGDGTDYSCQSVPGGSVYYNYMAQLNQYCRVNKQGGTYNFTDVAISYSNSSATASCAVADNGKIYCWGVNNSYGTLGKSGNGTGYPEEVNTSGLSPVPTFEKVYGSAYDTNYGFFCALDTNGKAYCWGYNGQGQLGTGDTSTRYAPSPVLGNYSFEELALGLQHTCGVTTAGLVYCWGGGSYGQLGYGSTSNKIIPEPVTGGADYVGIAAGAYQTYAWK